MRNFIILFIWLSCLPFATRGQTLEDAELEKLLQPIQAQSLLYWFDEDASNIQTVSGLAGTYILDVSPLSDGLHILHYLLIGADGATYDTKSDIFIKMEEVLSEEIFGTTVAAKGFVYWFDDDAGNKQTTYNLSGKYTLDVSSLDDGLHTLHYYVIGDDGLAYGTTTEMFLKNEEQFAQHKPNGIVKYKYWLNKDKTTVQTVTLDEPVNPYSLISLLPIQKMPIRSSSFHFQVNDGAPAIYAKNDFNIRFYDARGEFVDNFMTNERTFIDYSVSQQVVPVGELQETQTFERMAENEIRWYTVEAVRGDSLAFKTDKACSIQLFSPSGDEVYSASGAESVNWDGCHAREDGTFYLALHDVTAKTGTEIILDYLHIDKYAVLRQDVYVVGNGGCSTITFEGNGFRDLYAVDLFTEQGDSIQYVYIGHESDATTSVIFDFTDAALGTYHAKFRFAEEDKVFNSLVTVEEARDIELATTVTYPSTFLSGTSTTYTIKITNKGNMTAYNMPLNLIIRSFSSRDIKNINICGLDFNPLFFDINKETLSIDELYELQSLEKEIGNDYLFLSANIFDETICDSIYQKTGLFFVDIPPNTEKIITIDLYVNSSVELKVLTPTSLNPLSTLISEYSRTERKLDLKETYCCWRDQIECVLSIASDIAALSDFITAFDPTCTGSSIATISNCLIGTFKQVVRKFDISVCGNANHRLPATYEDLSNIGNNFSFFGSICSCLSKALTWGKVAKIVEGIKIMGATTGVLGGGLSAFSTATDCLIAVGEMISNIKCPSSPHIGGGISTPVTSLDPNDIFGYTAESGSHAVKDGLTDVYYRIEFENDPEFATASAHEIVVTDVLDATKFDLSTFKPTRVRIGDKSAELTGDKNFVTTIDMRPEINAIAQVEGTFDQQTGIAKWHISSLDPMTMEPTDDVMQGVLPVNHGGNGIGEVMFDISLKPGLVHGTAIDNRAGIVFDQNEVIMTPTWTNTIDRVKPVSHITNVEQVNGGETATVSIEATDELSGPWRYNVYVQYGSGAWFLAAENVPIDTEATVKLYEDIEHHFYCVTTDMAGNVEQKEPESEFSLAVGKVTVTGDINSDGKVDVSDYIGVANHILGSTPAGFNEKAADVNNDGKIDVSDYIGIANIILTGSVYGK